MGTSMQITGVGSYVTVLEPKPDQKGKLKYSVTILIPKSRGKELDPLRAEAIRVAKEKWGAKGEAILASAKNKMIQDGDTYVPQDGGEPDPSYKNNWFIRMRTDRKPQVIDGKKNPIFTDDDCYSGCLLRVSGNAFAYEREGNRGVSFGLNNVQVLEKRARLDGRKSAEDEFQEYTPPEVDPTS